MRPVRRGLSTPGRKRRELQHALESATLMVPGTAIERGRSAAAHDGRSHPTGHRALDRDQPIDLEAVEKELIQLAMRRNARERVGGGRLLSIGREALRYRWAVRAGQRAGEGDGEGRKPPAWRRNDGERRRGRARPTLLVPWSGSFQPGWCSFGWAAGASTGRIAFNRVFSVCMGVAGVSGCRVPTHDLKHRVGLWQAGAPVTMPHPELMFVFGGKHVQAS